MSSSLKVDLITRNNHVISWCPFRILNEESLLHTVLHDFQSRIATSWISVNRSDMRSGDLEIGELLKSGALAGTLALMHLHPVQVVVSLFPVAEHEGHLSDLIGHSVKILRAALSVHLDLLPALRKRENVAVKSTVHFLEINLHMEGLECVDQVGVLSIVGSIGSTLGQVIVVGIDRALATVVASREDTIGIRLFAVMSSCVEAILISLHEVKLWAQGILSTMVSVSVAIAEDVMSVVDSGHENRFKVGNTAAAHTAQVNVVLKYTTQHVRLVEARGIICASFREVVLLLIAIL